MTTGNQQLTSADRQLLAREVAADRFEVGEDLIEWECYECGERGDVEGVPVVLVREAAKHGWDAAMEWMKQETERGKTELEQPPRP